MTTVNLPAEQFGRHVASPSEPRLGLHRLPPPPPPGHIYNARRKERVFYMLCESKIAPTSHNYEHCADELLSRLEQPEEKSLPTRNSVRSQ